MEKKQLFRNSVFILFFLCAAFTVSAQVRVSDFRYIDNIEGYWTMKTKLGLYAEKWKRVDDTVKKKKGVLTHQV